MSTSDNCADLLCARADMLQFCVVLCGDIVNKLIDHRVVVSLDDFQHQIGPAVVKRRFHLNTDAILKCSYVFIR